MENDELKAKMADKLGTVSPEQMSIVPPGPLPHFDHVTAVPMHDKGTFKTWAIRAIYQGPWGSSFIYFTPEEAREHATHLLAAADYAEQQTSGIALPNLADVVELTKED